MKKISLLLFLSVLCFDTVFANPVEPEKALETANNFWEQQIKETETLILKSPRKLSKAGNRIKLQEKNPQYYICTPESGKGFVIVAGEDMLSPIVGYSTEGFNENSEMPTTLIEWLNEYSMYVDDVRSGKAKHVKKETRAGKTAIAPMLKTTWNQLTPYNNLCPEINGQKTPTGCVATAMAQIMKFHEWPQKPKQDISWYNNITNEIENIDITSHIYDWKNMLPDYSKSYTEEQANAVAQLMVDVGKAIGMNYALGGSSSATEMAQFALENIFDYSKSIKTISRLNSTEEEYISTIRENLVEKRPVLYSGMSEKSAHAFICDGIDEKDFLHIDWGWGGAYNGYFDMTYMTPQGVGIGGGEGSYNLGQSMIVNIAPSTVNIKDDKVDVTLPELSSISILKIEYDEIGNGYYVDILSNTIEYSENSATFLLDIFIKNNSDIARDFDIVLAIEEEEDKYRILENTISRFSLEANKTLGKIIELNVDKVNSNDNSFFENGTYKLKVLYKNKKGEFVKIESHKNILMLDVNDGSAKLYTALPDVTLSEINISSSTMKVGDYIKFDTKFVNKNTHNASIRIVPIINTTLANGSVVRDTLKNEERSLSILDNRDIYIKFDTNEVFKLTGKCNISFAYRKNKMDTYKNVNGSSGTFDIKEEGNEEGVPVITAMNTTDIKYGEHIDIAVTITNKPQKNYNYSATLSLSIRNNESDEIYTLLTQGGIDLGKDESITLYYKSADYFPTLPTGQYEILVRELKYNKWGNISPNKYFFNIAESDIIAPYICQKTNISNKSITPGDSVDVIITASAYNGTFDGYLKINTTYGLTTILRSDYVPVTIYEGITKK